MTTSLEQSTVFTSGGSSAAPIEAFGLIDGTSYAQGLDFCLVVVRFAGSASTPVHVFYGQNTARDDAYGVTDTVDIKVRTSALSTPDVTPAPAISLFPAAIPATCVP